MIFKQFTRMKFGFIFNKALMTLKNYTFRNVENYSKQFEKIVYKIWWTIKCTRMKRK